MVLFPWASSGYGPGSQLCGQLVCRLNFRPWFRTSFGVKDQKSADHLRLLKYFESQKERLTVQQCNVHIFLSSISFACSDPRRIFHSPLRSQSFLFRFLVPGQSHNPVCLPLVVGLTAKLFSKIYDEIVSKLFDFVSSHVATVLSSQLSSILVWFFGGPNPNRKKRIRTYVHGSDHWGHQESCGLFGHLSPSSRAI